MTKFTTDQVLGCIVGGAIGDAIGGISERKRISLSDDTQFTLATCEALTTSGPSPVAIAESMLRWFRERRITGIGAATLKAMRDLDSGNHWALAGARGEMAAGNGAAMRIAPLAFVVDPLSQSDRVLVRDISRITHHSDEAYIGALAVLVAMHLSDSSSLTLASISDHLPDSRVRDRLIEMSGASEASLSKLATDFGASGYVVDTVPLAIIAATRMSAETFESVLYELNETGGDSDTIGSIAGQIAGVHVGLEALPDKLLSLLPDEPSVLAIARAFAKAANQAVAPDWDPVLLLLLARSLWVPAGEPQIRQAVTQDWQKLLTFPERSIPRYAIPVKPVELQVGEVYFRLHYLDDRMRIPELVPLVFIGRDAFSDPEQGHSIDFQDADSYLSGDRFDDPPAAVEGETEEDKYESILRRPRFESFNEADGGGVYTFENALNLLLLCWLENYAPKPPIA